MANRHAAASCVAGLLALVPLACTDRDLDAEAAELRDELRKADAWLAHPPQTLREASRLRELLSRFDAGLARDEERWTQTYGGTVARRPRDSPRDAVRWTTVTLSGGPSWADAGPLLDDLSRVRAAALVSSVRFDEKGSTWRVEVLHGLFQGEPRSSSEVREETFVWPWQRERHEENERLRRQLEQRLARPELATLVDLLPWKENLVDALSVLGHFQRDLPALDDVASALRLLHDEPGRPIRGLGLSRTGGGAWELHLDLEKPLPANLLVATMAPLHFDVSMKDKLYARRHEVQLTRRAVAFERVRRTAADAFDATRYADWVLSWAANYEDDGRPSLGVALEAFPQATPGERTVLRLARTCETFNRDEPADLDARKALWERCVEQALLAAEAAKVPLERHAGLQRLATAREPEQARDE